MLVSARFTLLALAVLLLAHQLASVVAYGWQEAALSGGHDRYGLLGGAIVLMGVVVALGLGIHRLRRLHSRLRPVRALRGRRAAEIDWRAFVDEVARLTPKIAVAAVLIFLVQENVEHAVGNGMSDGMHLLFAEGHAATLPIFLVVATVVAGVVSLLRIGLAVLASLAERQAKPRPEPRPLMPASQSTPAYRWARLAPDLGRAPPPSLS
jgi:hypothetical protein